MSRCPQCQHENPGDAKFCLECGRRLALACGACGIELPAGAKFCKECGRPVGTATSPTAARVGAPPQSYTPKHLAEKILTSKAALEGERKQVTVLFADLKGSMELLADRDPEEARTILDPVLELMMQAVHRYEGTVNQVMGDGIMALFGAPLAHEDHAVRACYAALRMQESVKKYAEGVRREQGVTIRIRVGLNSGEVVVRAIGSDLHMDYTAVGQTTHLAARMEQLADPGTILLTYATLQLVEGYVEVAGRGPVPVKGLAAPVEVYELTGAGSVRSRLQVAAARGLTRFVGRDPEMEQLRRALDRAGAGRGQVVGVVGEPGVGKSRLYWELIHSPSTAGWLVLESRSVSYGKATSYLPVIDLVKGYFQIEAQDEPGRMREKVTGKLLGLDEALGPALQAFLALLDLPVEDATWQALEPPQRRQRTLDAVKRLLLRESRVQPVLVVFEDLHWIDSETQALLDSLVESLPTARLLLLVNYRPEYEHRWGGKTYYRQLQIEPLPVVNADELLDELLGHHATVAPLKHLLVERTDRNPLFLEESVRDLVETGTLLGESGAYRLAKDVITVGVAPTVQAVLAARIDRLSPEDKRLLQSAATIGKHVPFGLLQAIVELSDEDLRRGIGTLQRAEFLYETTVFPEPEFTFKHALTHEVAYGTMLRERRTGLHGRIANCLETLSNNRPGEYIDALAHHASCGEIWDKALRYRHVAGNRARDLAAYQAARSNLEQALIAAQHLPQTSEVVKQSIDVRLALQRVLYALNEIERCLDEGRRAECLATSINDASRLITINSHAILYLLTAGEPDAAIDAAQRALGLAKSLQDRPGEAVIKIRLGQVFHGLGRHREAVTVLGESLDLVDDQSSERIGDLSVARRAWLCFALSDLGQFDEALAHARTAVEIVEDAPARGPFDRITAHVSLGYCNLQHGHLIPAIPPLECAYELCQQSGSAVWFFAVAACLTLSYARTGRHDSAMQRIQEFQAAEASIGPNFWFGRACGLLSEALLLIGRLAEGAEYAERGITLCRRYHARGDEAAACLSRAEAASYHPVEGALAEPNYRTTIALAEELGMRPLLGRSHLGLGRLFRQTGKRNEAHEHLITAIAMFREMGMTYWLEQAEAELRERPRARQ